MSASSSLRDPPHPLHALDLNPDTWPPLPREFYARPVLDLARALLGCLLISDVSADDGVAETGRGVTGGVIVETEAYAGVEDLASHARAGLTRRTAPMFGEAGHAYVYLVYGMHRCLNVVGDIPGRAGAVLVRAIEPRVGTGLMRERRGEVAAAGPESRLAAGPARLCQALGVTRRLDSHDLTLGHLLWMAAPASDAPPHEIVEGPRIGVAYAGAWADRPWRFGVAGSPALSRPFAGTQRTAHGR